MRLADQPAKTVFRIVRLTIDRCVATAPGRLTEARHFPVPASSAKVH